MRRAVVAAVFHWTPQTFRELTWSEIGRWYEDAQTILELRSKGGVI